MGNSNSKGRLYDNEGSCEKLETINFYKERNNIRSAEIIERRSNSKDYNGRKISLAPEIEFQCPIRVMMLDGFTKGAVKNLLLLSWQRLRLYSITENSIELLENINIYEEIIGNLFIKNDTWPKRTNLCFSPANSTLYVAFLNSKRAIRGFSFDNVTGRLLKIFTHPASLTNQKGSHLLYFQTRRLKRYSNVDLLSLKVSKLEVADEAESNQKVIKISTLHEKVNRKVITFRANLSSIGGGRWEHFRQNQLERKLYDFKRFRIFDFDAMTVILTFFDSDLLMIYFVDIRLSKIIRRLTLSLKYLISRSELPSKIKADCLNLAFRQKYLEKIDLFHSVEIRDHLMMCFKNAENCCVVKLSSLLKGRVQIMNEFSKYTTHSYWRNAEFSVFDSKRIMLKDSLRRLKSPILFNMVKPVNPSKLAEFNKCSRFYEMMLSYDYQNKSLIKFMKLSENKLIVLNTFTVMVYDVAFEKILCSRWHSFLKFRESSGKVFNFGTSLAFLVGNMLYVSNIEQNPKGGEYFSKLNSFHVYDDARRLLKYSELNLFPQAELNIIQLSNENILIVWVLNYPDQSNRQIQIFTRQYSSQKNYFISSSCFKWKEDSQIFVRSIDMHRGCFVFLSSRKVKRRKGIKIPEEKEYFELVLTSTSFEVLDKTSTIEEDRMIQLIGVNQDGIITTTENQNKIYLHQFDFTTLKLVLKKILSLESEVIREPGSTPFFTVCGNKSNVCNISILGSRIVISLLNSELGFEKMVSIPSKWFTAMKQAHLFRLMFIQDGKLFFIDKNQHFMEDENEGQTLLAFEVDFEALTFTKIEYSLFERGEPSRERFKAISGHGVCETLALVENNRVILIEAPKLRMNSQAYMS